MRQGAEQSQCGTGCDQIPELDLPAKVRTKVSHRRQQSTIRGELQRRNSPRVKGFTYHLSIPDVPNKKVRGVSFRNGCLPFIRCDCKEVLRRMKSQFMRG